MTPTARAEAYEKRGRALRLAQTYLRKAERLIGLDLPVDPGYADLLDVALDVADTILRALPDDHFEEWSGTGILDGQPLAYNPSDDTASAIERLAAEVARRRARAGTERKIRALEDVAGRTPEEAEAYLAKAADLRSRL